MTKNNKKIEKKVKPYSGKLDYSLDSISIILVAGHGKRIRSETPKVIHPIWGVPSVLRVSSAVKKGLDCKNQIIVVGIKALEVAKLFSDNSHTVFAYQGIQRGTGHALQVAMKLIKDKKFSGNIYVFPGDMGLIDPETIKDLKKSFENSDHSLMLLSGKYQGAVETNYYGRILRVPKVDINGKSSGRDYDKVIEIKQHRDILKLNSKVSSYITSYNGRKYAFSKDELLRNNEFDSGVFVFKAGELKNNIGKLRPDNVQKEIYITDLVKIFNSAGLKVGLREAKNSELLLGFNNKSTLKKMEAVVREKYYEILKDIISIEDEEKFFVAEEVIQEIIKLDKKKGPLDIILGEDCHISSGVKLNKGTVVGKNTVLEGNIILGENVKLRDNVHISTYPDQVLKIGEGAEILDGDIIKGNTQIAKNVRIETGVNITGSGEFPTRIGEGTLIKGTTYIFGSIIEPNNWIEQSILVKKYVQYLKKKDGTTQKIKYIQPLPEGIDSINPIENI